MRSLRLFLIVSSILALSVPAFAGDWAEDGDAPELPPAQVTSGTGTLDSIVGSFIADDADLYCITINDPVNFVATTDGGTAADTRLMLFAMDGTGITYNDDSPSGGLQSTITGVFLTDPGQYMLAIVEYSKDAQNAAGLAIWASSPFSEERAPDGPGAADPVLAMWEVDSNTERDYTIFLTGTSFCDGPISVEGTTWGSVKALYR